MAYEPTGQQAAQATESAAGSLTNSYDSSDGAHINSYADGNGGTTTVKTRPDGTVVKTDSTGNVVSDTATQNQPTGLTLDDVKAVKTEVSDMRNGFKAQQIMNAGPGTNSGDMRRILADSVVSDAAKKAWDEASRLASNPAAKALDKNLGGASALVDGYSAYNAYQDGDVQGAVGDGASAAMGAGSYLKGGPQWALGSATWTANYKYAGPEVEKATHDTPSMNTYRDTVAQLQTECGDMCSVGYTVVAGPGHVIMGSLEAAENGIAGK